MNAAKFSQTPLLELLSRGLPGDEAVQKALEEARPGDINTSNGSNLSPLKAAIMNTSVHAVGLVIEAGAVVDDEHLAFAETKYAHKKDVCEFLRAVYTKQMLQTQTAPTNKVSAFRL